MLSKIVFRTLIVALILLGSQNYAHADKNLDSITIAMKAGVSLNRLLELAGIHKNDATDAVEELTNVYNPKQILVGQEIKINFEIMDTEGKEIRFSSMEIKLPKSQKIAVTRLDNDIFFAHIFESKNQPKLIYIQATIGATMLSAAKNAGLTQEMFNELVKAYSYDVDFQRDVKQGDKLEVLYEGIYDEEGKLISAGDVLYTTLTVNSGKFIIFHYTTPDGKADFYSKDGESVQRSLLKTPVNGARISSGYGTRHHPILGFTKAHKGVDFAAPTGTPVYAAGNGTILEIKRKGSYGKYIKIFHNGIYTTTYAHLNGFARNLQRGSKVTQGQVVGYVGSTGRSSGPHLHYEIIEKGQHVNPLMIKSNSGKQLVESEKELFFKYRDSLLGAASRLAAKSKEG